VQRATDAAVKAMSDRIDSLQRKIEQQRKP
jgi:hypothetical protein